MIIQILLRLLSTPKPTMNAQLFPADRLDKMRIWDKILRPDCCRRLILNHKSHYNILLRIQIDIRNAAEAVLMQKQREEAQGVSVKVWALGGMSGWHPVLPPALQLTTPLPPTTLWLLLGWCSKARYHWDNLSFSYAQRFRCVCLSEMRASIFMSPSITIPNFVSEHLLKMILLREDWLGSAGLGWWR